MSVPALEHRRTRIAGLVQPGMKGFAPSDIAGILMWIDASSIAGKSNLDTLDAVSDLSGNTNNWSQATAGSRPTYRTNYQNGLPVIDFDGSDDFMSFTARMTTMRTVFIVTKADVSTGYRFLFGDTDSYYWHSGDGTLFGIYTNSYITGGDIRYNGTVTAYNAARPSSMAIISVITTANVESNMFSKDRGEGRYWDGPLGELLAYSGALTDANFNSILNYLGAKWGISVTPK